MRVLLTGSATGFNRLFSLLFGACLMIALSSYGSVLPFNCASNGLGSNWTLVFSDNFSGTSLNKTNWVPYWFSDGTVLPGSTTPGYASNVVVNGQLNLTRISTNGACISSNPDGGAKPGFQFTYGYAEAQLTLPTNGTVIAQWPAWWLDGQEWPEDGEIDIMEGLSGHAAWHYHYDDDGVAAAIGGNINTSPGTHIYGVNWYPGHLDYYYDGTLVASATNGSLSGGATISSSPMYLILLYASGSGSVPATMVVHYVRVFQTPPPLSALPGKGAVSLSWNLPGFILQTNGDLMNTGGWADVANATNSPTTMSNGGDYLFFRLRSE
ncbi:MAG TPA: glycoside hydrolase family 16 protein [Candidatus Sulfotelmatobacter sp.]|nr:glycoside hydrolase family 16 protein [Candidatus Sulfotelmatobacter sp.]